MAIKEVIVDLKEVILPKPDIKPQQDLTGALGNIFGKNSKVE